MKIAFEKRLPDPESFFQLVNSGLAIEKEGAEADKKYALLKRYSGVVAAYDGDTLVAVGGMQSHEWYAAIRPEYMNRDLESNMKKLLG